MRNTIAAAVSVAALLAALLLTRGSAAEAAAEKRGQCGCAAPAMVCGDRTAPMCAIACDPGYRGARHFVARTLRRSNR